MLFSARDSLQRLKTDYGDVSEDIRTEAASNLQARTNELAKNYSLKQRRAEQIAPGDLNSLDFGTPLGLFVRFIIDYMSMHLLIDTEDVPRSGVASHGRSTHG